MTQVPEKYKALQFCSSWKRKKYVKISACVFPSHNQIFTRLDHFIWKLGNQDKLFLNRTKNFFLNDWCIYYKWNEQDCGCAVIFQNFVNMQYIAFPFSVPGILCAVQWLRCIISFCPNRISFFKAHEGTELISCPYFLPVSAYPEHQQM